MTAADIPAIVGVEAQSFYDAWNENMLLNEINNSLTTYLVMEEQGKLVGYAGFWLVAGEAQVTRVAVVEAERGQGYGTRLTAALVNKAWELGADAVTLEVRESNIAAQKAYLTCGFASEGIRPNYYEDNHENAVIMWLYKEGAGHE
ncbi:ribosomal protein S18-alanine N-acetyltransferase [Phascolarctobacterium sp.]|uniref:ribosomal protein S18-alanine N-acetyltransferase n=1 Tax=Phascolarctobacterium sp. TaxID=2049039 RepID=UPI003868D71C